MDLVDEQDVAVLEVGEQGGKVARLGDDRARGGAKADAHLARQDRRKRGLAQARRPVQQDMVERLAAALGGADEHAQILARRLLADEFVEAFRAQRVVGVLAGSLGRRDPGGVGRHLSLALLAGPPLPRPAALDLELEAEAEEGPDGDDRGEHDTLRKVGVTATVLMMSAAIRNSRPSRIERPKLERNVEPPLPLPLAVDDASGEQRQVDHRAERR